jgi:ribosomal protein S11
MAITKSKKKVVKKVSHGIAHVVATNNNTRITITDQSGAVLTWATAGANNFKVQKNLHHTLRLLLQMQLVKRLQKWA